MVEENSSTLGKSHASVRPFSYLPCVLCYTNQNCWGKGCKPFFPVNTYYSCFNRKEKRKEGREGGKGRRGKEERKEGRKREERRKKKNGGKKEKMKGRKDYCCFLGRDNSYPQTLLKSSLLRTRLMGLLKTEVEPKQENTHLLLTPPPGFSASRAVRVQDQGERVYEDSLKLKVENIH